MSALSAEREPHPGPLGCPGEGCRCRRQPRKAGTDVTECEAMGKLLSMEG